MAETAHYIRKHASRITPGILRKLLPKLPLLKAEFTQINAPQFPHLIDQLEFLADYVEDFAEGADAEITYVSAAEATFALLYAHKHMDLIPDSVSGQGHADDSVVVRSILISHEKDFSAYATRHGVKWTQVTSEP